jgi:competence protein ComEC
VTTAAGQLVEAVILEEPEQDDEGRSSEELDVTFLDVGKGSSILVEGPDDNILVDAGGERGLDFIQTLEAELDDESIDTVVVSHNHTDHIRYLDEVTAEYDVNTIYYSGISIGTNTESDLEDMPVDETIILEEGNSDTISLGDGATVDIVHMQFGTEPSNADAHSLITRVSYHGQDFLMTGDIRDKRERTMTLDYRGLVEDVDVLEVPHHGSHSSGEQVLTTELLTNATPSSIIISNNNDRSRGPDERHAPNCAVFNRVADYNNRQSEDTVADVYWTEPHGNIRFTVREISEDNWDVVTPNDRNRNMVTVPETLRDEILERNCGSSNNQKESPNNARSWPTSHLSAAPKGQI